MSDVPFGALVGALIVLIVLSAFFSSSETGMMALNRYRLRHLARQKHRGAIRAAELLKRPDRLIGVILLGNNLVNIAASSLATIIGFRLAGEAGIAIAAGILTLVILIFAEVAPKTLAAIRPERIAFPASMVLRPLLTLCYPVVWLINSVANGLLRAFKASPGSGQDQLSSDELRTVVNEAGAVLSRRYQRMLVSILDLEKVTVDDIMVPRNEINGIDLDDEPEDILEQVSNSQHTLLPMFRGDINNIEGVLHLRKLILPLRHEEFSIETLRENAWEPYFVPEGTPLDRQLHNFQRRQLRIGLVVDEYGDILGLVTLEDILEEIVGEFTTDPAARSADIHPQPDGTYLVDGSANIRDLNRSMQWNLPTDGPKTLNGLILEYLEAIPEPGTSLLLSGYPVEIVQTSGNAVRTARVNPVKPRRRVRRPGH